MELQEADQPPEEIWLDSEAIAAHFESVHAKYRTGSDDDVEAVMDQNELTRDLRRR